MVTIKNIYDELGWEPADGYPKGTRIKTLRDENGAQTVLLKLPKGFYMEPHSHLFNEQHLILEGEYESEGETYSSGAFRIIHAGKNHGPFSSKNGATVLVIWDPVK
ncbi:chrR Cupin-like domain protein [bacterium BMS3Abin04]|nr:chrR Cupin-like domain protein [bacterium BMS3Abin04]